jgi:hypothetical protein
VRGVGAVLCRQSGGGQGGRFASSQVFESFASSGSVCALDSRTSSTLCSVCLKNWSFRVPSALCHQRHLASPPAPLGHWTLANPHRLDTGHWPTLTAWTLDTGQPSPLGHWTLANPHRLDTGHWPTLTAWTLDTGQPSKFLVGRLYTQPRKLAKPCQQLSPPGRSDGPNHFAQTPIMYEYRLHTTRGAATRCHVEQL